MTGSIAELLRRIRNWRRKKVPVAVTCTILVGRISLLLVVICSRQTESRRTGNTTQIGAYCGPLAQGGSGVIFGCDNNGGLCTPGHATAGDRYWLLMQNEYGFGCWTFDKASGESHYGLSLTKSLPMCANGFLTDVGGMPGVYGCSMQLCQPQAIGYLSTAPTNNSLEVAQGVVVCINKPGFNNTCIGTVPDMPCAIGKPQYVANIQITRPIFAPKFDVTAKDQCGNIHSGAVQGDFAYCSSGSNPCTLSAGGNITIVSNHDGNSVCGVASMRTGQSTFQVVQLGIIGSCLESGLLVEAIYDCQHGSSCGIALTGGQSTVTFVGIPAACTNVTGKLLCFGPGTGGVCYPTSAAPSGGSTYVLGSSLSTQTLGSQTQMPETRGGQCDTGCIIGLVVGLVVFIILAAGLVVLTLNKRLIRGTPDNPADNPAVDSVNTRGVFFFPNAANVNFGISVSH